MATKSARKRTRHYAELSRAYRLSKIIQQELERIITVSFLARQLRQVKMTTQQAKVVSQIDCFNARWHRA